MSLSFNGTEPGVVKYNSADVDKVLFNGTEVWNKLKAKVATISGYSGTLFLRYNLSDYMIFTLPTAVDDAYLLNKNTSEITTFSRAAHNMAADSGSCTVYGNKTLKLDNSGVLTIYSVDDNFDETSTTVQLTIPAGYSWSNSKDLCEYNDGIFITIINDDQNNQVVFYVKPDNTVENFTIINNTTITTTLEIISVRPNKERYAIWAISANRSGVANFFRPSETSYSICDVAIDMNNKTITVSNHTQLSATPPTLTGATNNTQNFGGLDIDDCPLVNPIIKRANMIFNSDNTISYDVKDLIDLTNEWTYRTANKYTIVVSYTNETKIIYL